MPRKQVEDLQRVNLGGAAHQVNTFVAAPRAARTNKAMALSQAFSGIGDLIEQKQELDVKQATDRKLYGSAVYTDIAPERLAEYEANKGQLRSMEDAEKWFLDSTKQDFDDPHAAAGYEEKRGKELQAFRGKHAEYLSGVAVKERSDHVMKDYISTVSTDGVAAAEARKNDIAKNYGMSPKDLNQMTVNSAGILIAQGKLDEAEAVLTHKRGAAGTLLDNPDTAEEAQVLNKKLETARKDMEDAKVSEFKKQREVSELQRAKNESDFTDTLDDEGLSYEEKIIQLNKMDVLGDVSTKYATEARRYLKSLDEQDKETNADAMASIVERIYDVNTQAQSDPKAYLRGISQIQRDIMNMRASKELSRDDEQKLKGQLKTLTSPKVAEATDRIGRSFRDAQKEIEKQLPASYRGEAIRQLFYETDAEALQAEADGKSKKEIKALYKEKVNGVIESINQQRREATQKAINQTKDITDEDTQFIKKLGYSMDDVSAQAKSAGISESEVLSIIRSKFETTEVPGKTSPASSESNQILKDEGVVKNQNGEHVSYNDPLGKPTGGHGHLLTAEEQKKYPIGTVIPQEVVDQWKEQDLQEAEEDVSAIFGDVKHPEVRQVLKNMAYNLGRGKLGKFTRLKEAIQNEDYKLAAKAMKESLWYQQTGDRSKRLVDLIEQLT